MKITQLFLYSGINILKHGGMKQKSKVLSQYELCRDRQGILYSEFGFVIYLREFFYLKEQKVCILEFLIYFLNHFPSVRKKKEWQMGLFIVAK